MNFDLISLANSQVTPDVLAKTAAFEGAETSKESALNAYYSIFFANLSDQATYSRVSATEFTDELTFGLWTNNEQNTDLVSNLAREYSLPDETVQALINTASPRLLTLVNEHSQGTGAVAYLSSHQDALRTTLPVWSEALVPASFVAAPVAAEEVLLKEEKPQGSPMKAILPILGLILLAGIAWAMMKGCSPSTQAPPTDVVPAAPASALDAPLDAQTTIIAPAPARLELALDEMGTGIYACRGLVGDQATREGINTAITGTFANAGTVCAYDVDNDYQADLPALAHLPTILAALQGKPSSTIVVENETIYVNAADIAVRDTLIADLETALTGTNLTVLPEPDLDVATLVTNSITGATQSIHALGDTLDANDLVRALNQQIINFEYDRAIIPEENKPVLDAAAAKLMAMPHLSLDIIGHTDSDGSESYNQPLSESRAQAVHDYLVAQGVPDEQLSARGVNFQFPVASNATEQGKFRNRRIEFKIVDAGEVIATVDDLNTAPAPLTSDAFDANAPAPVGTAPAVLPSATAPALDGNVGNAGSVVNDPNLVGQSPVATPAP